MMTYSGSETLYEIKVVIELHVIVHGGISTPTTQYKEYRDMHNGVVLAQHAP